MKVLKAFCLAFSTYSRIPMISVYPNKESMRCLLCFFPLVGAVTGGLLMVWFWVCGRLGIGSVCFAAVAAALPLLVTGGIHADGYIDTNDALSSYGSVQKKLEILSDPHVGAFGIITAIVYYLLYFGMLNEVTTYSEAASIATGFIMSRALCAVTIALMRTAKSGGMLYELSSAVNKSATIITSVLIFIACAVVMTYFNVYIGVMVFLCFVIFALYYKFFVANKLGGITGDTCGWFIQMCELIAVIAVVIGGRLF